MRQLHFDMVRLLFAGTDSDILLQRMAEDICRTLGYDRCLIAGVNGGLSGEIGGRAGFGLEQEDVLQVAEMLSDVPVLKVLLSTGEISVLQPADLRAAIPQRYLDLFDVQGTLVVVPLTDARFGPIGLMFLDRRPHVFTPQVGDLDVLKEMAEIATLTVQNAALIQDRTRLVTVLERSRLASELHDGVTQRMFALGLTLQEMAELEDLPDRARELLDRAVRDTETGNAQLRQALQELTQDQKAAPLEQQRSFETRLRDIVDEFRDETAIGADVEIRGLGTKPSEETRELLLRTAREALTNVTKHAQATQVTVILRRSNHHWALEVHDDGTGSANGIRRRESDADHYGLRSLRTDARREQARLWVSQSALLGGVQVTMSVEVTS